MRTIFTEKNHPEAHVEPNAKATVTKASKSIELQNQLTKDKPRMGPVQSILHNLEVSKTTRVHLDQMFEVIMEKAKDDLKHKLMLQHDIEKKANHAKYLEVAGTLDQKVVAASQSLDRSLVSMLPDELGRIFKIRSEWASRIEDMPITPAMKEREEKRMEKWIDAQAENLDGKIELLMRNHAIALQRTLTLLGEEPPV